MGGRQSIPAAEILAKSPTLSTASNLDLGSEDEFWLGLNPDEPWTFGDSDSVTGDNTLALDKFVKNLVYYLLEYKSKETCYLRR